MRLNFISNYFVCRSPGGDFCSVLTRRPHAARDHFSGSWGALGASGPHGPLRHALMAFWISLASFPNRLTAFCTSSSTTYVAEEKCLEASRIRDAAASRCSMNSSQLLLRRAMAASISFTSIIVASCRKIVVCVFRIIRKLTTIFSLGSTASSRHWCTLMPSRDRFM